MSPPGRAPCASRSSTPARARIPICRPAGVRGTTSSTATPILSWTTGSGVSQYYLFIGSVVGGADIYAASQGSSTSGTVTGLPTDGRALYVRLWSLTSAGWQFRDYTYTASPPPPAVLTSPAPGSTLPGATVTFSWTPGSGVSQYYLFIGNSVGAADLYAASQGVSTSGTVTGLPTDGRTIYVRLWSLINNGWQFRDYSYTTTVSTVACVANAACTIDLSGCAEWQKASAWQGQTSLSGTLQMASYTSHFDWVCQTSIPQAWPVRTEPGWWCGTVVPQCSCSPGDNCY